MCLHTCRTTDRATVILKTVKIDIEREVKY